MREISLKVETKEVKSEVKQLKAKWTPELAKDLEMNHGLSIQTLLKELMTRQNRKKTIKNIFPD